MLQAAVNACECSEGANTGTNCFAPLESSFQCLEISCITNEIKMGQTLKEKAEEKLKSGNPTQLGDPVSLKAETSKRDPTEEEKGADRAAKDTNASQEENPSMLGDPISLKAEERAQSKEKRQSKI